MIQWLRKKSEEKVQDFGAQYVPFGLFGVINYPFSFFVLYFLGGQLYESLAPRLFATLLCVPLLFRKKLHASFERWLPLYWYAVLLYCVPVFATYMLMKNHFSIEWLMNIFLGIFWLILLVDWITFLLLIVIGIFIGLLWYFIDYGNLIYPDFKSYPQVIFAFSLYCYAILIGIIFARNKLVFDKEKMRTLQSFGTTIAHELQRSLDMMRHLTGSLESLLKRYIGTDKPLSETDGEFMVEFVEDVGILADRARYSVDSVLSNVRENLADMPQEQISVKDCLDDALESYPFLGDEEDQIKIIPKGDFSFHGNADLMQHVFLNLIHNSLYFINKTGNGKIIIEINPGALENIIIFKDTSVGIRPEFLPKVFEAFQSDRPHGTGIGLAFCKRAITAMGGTIVCDSVLGKHTTFTITFRD